MATGADKQASMLEEDCVKGSLLPHVKCSIILPNLQSHDQLDILMGNKNEMMKVSLLAGVG